ncbi:luciferin 4-monooxygenase-like [Dermacentor andersoni]|uniref:luciferin 4-monooxygenase-like n=1 Tax=Dermacentor andersoni TaxID=34620 RepID=UPI003B39FF30
MTVKTRNLLLVFFPYHYIKVMRCLFDFVRDTETKKPLGPRQRGDLVVRSPSLMRGYWGRLHEPITDEEGWYSTGDLCYYDKDGCLYLVARLSDYFCVRGCKYWPAEVEAMLLKCPGVHDCAVVGIPHPEAGEVAHAIVVPAPQARTLSAEHVTQFVEANASKGCRLEGGVTFVDMIPRSNRGKFVRRQLVQWIIGKREQGGINSRQDEA